MMVIYKVSQKGSIVDQRFKKRLVREEEVSTGRIPTTTTTEQTSSNTLRQLNLDSEGSVNSANNKTASSCVAAASIYSSSSDDEEEKDNQSTSTASRFSSFINFVFGGGKKTDKSSKDVVDANTECNITSSSTENCSFCMYDYVDSNDNNLLRCPAKLLEDPMKLLGRTVLVVGGCCEGVGYEIAYALAQLGARKVVLACANEKEAQEAIENMTDISRGVVEYMNLDLSSIQSIRQFVNFYQNVMNYECHVLVNTVLCTRQSRTGKNTPNRSNSERDLESLSNQMGPRFTKDGFERNFQLNYLGRILLIDMLSENLKRNHTRIVNVVELPNSQIQQKKLKTIPVYDLSASSFKKAYTEQDYINFSMRCNLLWVKSFANKYQQDGVTICCCDPELPETYKPPLPEIINQPTSTSSLLSSNTSSFFIDDPSHANLSITNDYAEEITNFDKIQSLLFGSLCDKQYFDNGSFITNYRAKALPSSFFNKKDLESNWETTANLIMNILTQLHSPPSSPSPVPNSK
ncbi:hypothetical protein FDP41_004799 [Naegleria fowleri]|uniref:Uncharacterized protein n=1 Tax=Naegleria fowleri TaxID=5763 RepID=A0A6A5BPT5_NAEFO|nr:uncharacterized protein FDP41_004799 [Naegleria fowleri]KAF0976124.1 hypothetical protein FDP41_004799 [Naegleria fowleri]CAG4716326.1 unnamed protein product [Naegleria fowleri]